MIALPACAVLLTLYNEGVSYRDAEAAQRPADQCPSAARPEMPPATTAQVARAAGERDLRKSLGLYGVEAPMEQAQEVAEVLVVRRSWLRNGAALAPHLVEIHRLENEADRLQRAAVAGLFANGIDPMMLIRWKDIFDTLEAAVDACESVANVLEGIAIKRAQA